MAKRTTKTILLFSILLQMCKSCYGLYEEKKSGAAHLGSSRFFYPSACYNVPISAIIIIIIDNKLTITSSKANAGYSRCNAINDDRIVSIVSSIRPSIVLCLCILIRKTYQIGCFVLVHLLITSLCIIWHIRLVFHCLYQLARDICW